MRQRHKEAKAGELQESAMANEGPRREEVAGFGGERGFGSYYASEYTNSGGDGGKQQEEREAAGFFDTGEASADGGSGALFGTNLKASAKKGALHTFEFISILCSYTDASQQALVEGFLGDDFGGGGFLMHGFDTGGFGAANQGVTAGRTQQQNAFAPVKIGALLHAFAQDPTAHEIYLAPPPASPLYIVRIVGRLSRIEDSPGGPAAAAAGKPGQHPREMLWDFSMGGRVSFEVEDGSGMLECDWHLGDDVTPYKQRAVESTLQLNRYVRIYGQLSLLGKPRPSLRVHAVRPVTSAAELLFHEVDCCSAFLRMKYAGETLPDPYEDSSPQQQQQPRQQQLQIGAQPGSSSAPRALSSASVSSSIHSASRVHHPAKDTAPHSGYGASSGTTQLQEFQQQPDRCYGEDGGLWTSDSHHQQSSYPPPRPYC